MKLGKLGGGRGSGRSWGGIIGSTYIVWSSQRLNKSFFERERDFKRVGRIWGQNAEMQMNGIYSFENLSDI